MCSFHNGQGHNSHLDIDLAFHNIFCLLPWPVTCSEKNADLKHLYIMKSYRDLDVVVLDIYITWHHVMAKD
jgi:hypothetical protein